MIKLSEAAGFGPCESHLPPSALEVVGTNLAGGAAGNLRSHAVSHCALEALDKGVWVTGNGPVGYRRPRQSSCVLETIDTRAWITGTQLIACRGLKI